MNKLTTDQLQSLTDEMSDYMVETGRKLFPPAKVDELAELGTKRCFKCTSVKLIEDFPKDSSKRDGLNSQCRTCACARDADYRKRNPEYRSEYHAANRESLNEYHRTQWATNEIYRLRVQLTNGHTRAVAAGVQADWITAEDLLQHWEQQGINPLICYLTSEELTPQNRSVDHVQAIGNGGPHSVDNLMPCTLEANKKKSNLEPDDVKGVVTND